MTGTPEPPEPRLDKLSPATLDDEQRAVYDAIAGGRRAQGAQLFPLVDDTGALEGPFNAFLLRPRLGFAWQALGAAVRYETALSDRAREIAILVTAAAARASFEWRSHEPIGRSAGLTGNELEALRAGRFGEFGDEDERLVAVTTHALCSRGDLDDEEYRRAVEGLGAAGLFEVLTVVGYYRALALQLRVFRVS
jgi:4-carboxymuconolactone decarboxylase